MLLILATMLCSVSNPDYNSNKSEDRNVAICNRHVTSSQKSDIYRRDGVNNRQGYCINHIIPLAIGGSNHADNLEAMRLDNTGACHAEGETAAINCFLAKECTQEEALEMMGMSI